MGLSIQEKKFKIDFQDGNCGGHLVFLIGMILVIFDLQVTSMILTKFQVNWPFGSADEVKTDFQDGRLRFPIKMIFTIFDLHVTLMLPTKLRVNWPFGSREEAKNRFSRMMATMAAILDIRSEQF